MIKPGDKAWIVTIDNEVFYAEFKLIDTGIFSAYCWEVDNGKTLTTIVHKYVKYIFRIKERKPLVIGFTKARYSYTEGGKDDYTWVIPTNPY